MEELLNQPCGGVMHFRYWLALAAALSGGLAISPASAESQCFGDYPYRFCTESDSDTTGDVRLISSDSAGSPYQLDGGNSGSPDGAFQGRSDDGMSKDYSIRSWDDAGGGTDNGCTILSDGTKVGC